MTKRNFFAIILLAFMSAQLPAQQPAATSGETKQLPSKVTRLNKAPVNSEILKVKLPHPVESKLPNGLTLLVLEQHRLPTIYCTLWIKSGALSEPKDFPGLASFTADLLREGTAKRSSTQIATELDELGATFNADAQFGVNHTTIQATGLSQSADKLMEMVSDIVLNANFPSAEIEIYRRRERGALTQLRANPAFLARERFAQAVYRDFPASVQAPTVDSLQKASTETLKDFHDKYYVPNNAILAISGDVTVAQANELAKKYFGEWKNHAVPAPELANVAALSAAKVYLVDRPGSVQSNILVGNLSLRRSDPDYTALAVANRVLGGGAAARLFSNLREEKSYTYGAYSRVTAELFPGTLVANTEVRNAVTDGSLHEILFELKRLRDEKVPSVELEDAKRSIVSSFALSLENPNAIMNDWITVKYYGLTADYWDHYSDQIAKVDAETVQRIAKKYVDLDHLQIVVVGDAKEVHEAVAKYGKVETFDADGKPVESKPAPAAGGSR